MRSLNSLWGVTILLALTWAVIFVVKIIEPAQVRADSDCYEKCVDPGAPPEEWWECKKSDPGPCMDYGGHPPGCYRTDGYRSCPPTQYSWEDPYECGTSSNRTDTCLVYPTEYPAGYEYTCVGEDSGCIGFEYPPCIKECRIVAEDEVLVHFTCSTEYAPWCETSS